MLTVQRVMLVAILHNHTEDTYALLRQLRQKPGRLILSHLHHSQLCERDDSFQHHTSGKSFWLHSSVVISVSCSRCAIRDPSDRNVFAPMPKYFTHPDQLAEKLIHALLMYFAVFHISLLIEQAAGT